VRHVKRIFKSDEGELERGVVCQLHELTCQTNDIFPNCSHLLKVTLWLQPGTSRWEDDDYGSGDSDGEIVPVSLLWVRKWTLG
jgi:hypothetical protein